MERERTRFDHTLWLVGMMEAGKSAVGPRLAERLHCPYHDTDAIVEAQEGRPVAEIFAERGESAFRAHEREAWQRLAGQPAVVSLGGGAVAEPGAAQALAESGTVVYLRARIETLMSRLGAARGRPLLAGLSAAERRRRLEKLLESREAHYADAGITVDTDDRTPDEVAAAVEHALYEATS